MLRFLTPRRLYIRLCVLFLVILLGSCSSKPRVFEKSPYIEKEWKYKYCQKCFRVESKPLFLVPHTVSLNDLKDKAQRERRHSKLLLSGLVDIHGYRWKPSSQDIELIGSRDSKGSSDFEITIDEIVAALRIGDQPTISMALIPKPSHLHQVIVNPSSIQDSRFIEVFIQADYLTKLIALGAVRTDLIENVVSRYQKRLEECNINTIILDVPAKIHFQADPDPDIEIEKMQDGFTLWLKKLNLFVLSAYSNEESSRSHNFILFNPVREFATDFQNMYRKIQDRYPIYQKLHSLYKLHLISYLLYLQRREKIISYDFKFWLSDYALSLHRTPRELPISKPQTIKFTCLKRPYKYKWRIFGGISYKLPSQYLRDQVYKTFLRQSVSE